MSIESKDIIKTYFETGDVPTESQFGNLIDSMMVHPTRVDFNTTATYVIPIGFMLQRLVIWAEASVISIKVGSTAGGDEYYDGNIPDASVPLIVEMGVYAHNVSKTIYLTGGLNMSFKAYLQ